MSKIEPIDPVVRKKDPYWWLHPAYRGEQSLDMATLDAMPEGVYKWVPYCDEISECDDIATNGDLTGGYFADFAQLLYKMNGFRLGPVENSYVIICLESSKRWAVGQLRADPVTPVQVFNNLIFDNESSARAQAEALRSS